MQFRLVSDIRLFGQCEIDIFAPFRNPIKMHIKLGDFAHVWNHV